MSWGRRRASAAAAGATSRQKQADDAIYDALAKQYEQFQQVNRTFELVAKAVSPAVVHIVAQKTTRAEDESAMPGNSRRPARASSSAATGAGGLYRSDQSSRGRRCASRPRSGYSCTTGVRSCR